MKLATSFIYDELPLWSAPFGLKLLEKVIFRSECRILDIGSGMGFPSIELVNRFGPSCIVYGIDPWADGLERANEKVKIMKLRNISFIPGTAEALPFENESFDLIISNNGINNVQDVNRSLAECFRVCRGGGQFVMTVNLPGTMKEFYTIFEKALKVCGLTRCISSIRDHIYEKRKPLKETLHSLKTAGFRVNDAEKDQFSLRFLNGTSLFNHYFIRLAFLDPWKSILNRADVPRVFTQLEKMLNVEAERKGELLLSIPFVCIDCRKEKMTAPGGKKKIIASNIISVMPSVSTPKSKLKELKS
jgi:arsenite methyltransferase